ncbi:MAG: NAD-binding protein [Candidatus Hydrothermia bacterium]|jgi:trk system potassium uptake protein TrkA
MNILIIGAGRFGKALARAFTSRGHSVVIVDRDENKIRGIEDEVAQAVILDSSDEDSLTQLALQDFDYVFLCISDISSSILTAQILLDSRVRRIYAKASGDVHAKILARLGVHKIIQPEKQSAESIAYNVMLGTEEFVELLRRKNFLVARVEVPPEFEGKTLSELELRKRFGIFVVAVDRNEPELKESTGQRTSLGIDSRVRTEILPDGKFILLRSDRLTVIGEVNNIEEFKRYVEEKS